MAYLGKGVLTLCLPVFDGTYFRRRFQACRYEDPYFSLRALPPKPPPGVRGEDSDRVADNAKSLPLNDLVFNRMTAEDRNLQW